MGLGNGNANAGNKGSNHSFEMRNLMILGDVLTAIAGVGGAPAPSGLATESTLLSILNNMVASQDVEILLVRDTGNADQVVQQIREYGQGTGTWTTIFEDVNGTAYAPTGPIVYLDPSAVLNLVLAELVSLNTTDFATETTLASLLTSSNLGASEITLAALLTAFNTEDFASQATLALLEGKDFATETTLGLLAVNVAGAATVAAGKRTISFFNSGDADVTVNGSVLAAGTGITYPELSNRDLYAAIPYNSLTSELTITTVG